MNILSIQSEVVYGHVGQGAARFALQRLGHEVWALPTVLLSSHAGYPRVEGEIVPVSRLSRLLDGLDANGWLAKCDAVLSGYLGSAEQVAVVADAVERAKRANAEAIYCLDPVLGDDGRGYATPGVAEAIARTLLPLADIATPNAFELVHLAGLPVRDRDEALAAARRLGRPAVVATSVPDGPDRIGVLAATTMESWFVSTPRLSDVPRGAGDLAAALFLAATLSGRALPDALEHTNASVFHLLKASIGRGEMQLIQEQHALGDPPPVPDLRIERIDS
jgi:pyridoxine kinase